MYNIDEKFLPLGTVVLLKGAPKKVMIIGFCPETKSVPSKYSDYTGCMYPEGILSSDQFIIFNHSQIEKVISIGFSDDEEKSFKVKLNQLIKNDDTSKTSNLNYNVYNQNIESTNVD